MSTLLESYTISPTSYTYIPTFHINLTMHLPTLVNQCISKRSPKNTNGAHSDWPMLIQYLIKSKYTLHHAYRLFPYFQEKLTISEKGTSPSQRYTNLLLKYCQPT